MSRFLVDTQTLVWLVDDSPSLGTRARALLENPENQVSVSYLALVEITIKAGIKKFTYNDSVFDNIQAMGIEIVQPDRALLKNYAILNPDNKDPFDNLMMSLARIQKLILVTSDHKILATSATGLKTLDASK